MMPALRRIVSGSFDWLRAEKPDRAVVALAIVAALAAAVVCQPNGFQRSGLEIPASAAWGIMGLGIGIAALAALRPWPGLLVWVVFMPLFTAARIGPIVGWVQITSATVILAVLLGSCLLGFRRVKPALPVAPLVLGGLMALAAILSTAVSSDLSNGVPITTHGIIEPIAVGIVIVLLRPGLRQLLALGMAMSASVAMTGVINLGRMLFVVRALSDWQTLRGEFGRITYYNVGLFAGIVVTVLPLLAVLIARPDLGGEAVERATSGVAAMAGRVATAWRSESAARAVTVVRIGAWVVLAFFLLLIDLSFSKSAWLAALVLGLIMVASMLRTWRRRAAGLAAIAVVATLFLLTSVVTAAPASDRNNSFDPNSSEGEVSITERYLATEAALHMTIDHPLFGVGPGLFGAEYAGPYRLPETKVVLQAAHNLIPNVAAEYGLPLAVLLSVTVVAALWVAWRLYRAGAGLAKLLAWAYGLALFGSMIVATLFGSDLYRTYRYMNTDVLYIGVLLGAICVLATIAKESPEASAIPE